MSRRRGIGTPHNTMVQWIPVARWDDRVCSAYCKDCDWAVDGLDYSRAVDQALAHQRQSEVPA